MNSLDRGALLCCEDSQLIYRQNIEKCSSEAASARTYEHLQELQVGFGGASLPGNLLYVARREFVAPYSKLTFILNQDM